MPNALVGSQTFAAGSSMQCGEKPVAAGQWFSLGHALIVVLVSAAVGFAATQVMSRFEETKANGSVVSTAASAGFLLLLAAFNRIILISVWRLFPIGFRYGLGFDTATEVALFGLSAPQAADGVSPLARLGYGIIVIFIASWVVSALIYRLRGYDALDVNTAA